MSKFWKTKEFKQLNKEWREKLKANDFKDLEDEYENLIDFDRRTIAFDNRIEIEQFFRQLDSFLTNTGNIPVKHREVLELYAQGVYIKGEYGIMERTKLSNSTVHTIIRKYKKIILG